MKLLERLSFLASLFIRISLVNAIETPQHHRAIIPDGEYACISRGVAANARSVFSTLRGGAAGLIEYNPNYVDANPNRFMPPTLGEIEDDDIRRPLNGNDFSYQRRSNVKQPLKPLPQLLKEFALRVNKKSPSLSYGMFTCILLFLVFRVPSFAYILRDHFVCSSFNLRKQRYHTLLTSAVTHTTIMHLLINMYAFYIFGNAVQPTLRANNFSLGVYCIVSAIFANIFFLLTSPKGGSCIGLSGVTLSLLALDAKLHPSKEIGFVLGIVPVRLPAQYALSTLMVLSVLGTFLGSNDGVAHGTHLGGLIFGIGIYEALHRGWGKKIQILSRKRSLMREPWR